MHFIYRGAFNEPLTEVKVNKLTKKVTFKNFTDDPIDCCFGVRTSATYKDVLDFFESRCFSRYRADIDHILKDFGFNEYDPYLLCKKFEGRNYQDDNWIEFLE